ncbi:MAG: hypothetical protein PHR30_16435 [Gallionellaceae bacterium]|nr:hypothetical protein [Gallionellaceae bacterium]
MPQAFFEVSAGTTARLIWANTNGFPWVHVKNIGTTGSYLKGSTLSSGSSESTGFYLSSGLDTHLCQLYPGDKLYIYTSGATNLAEVHVWGDLTDTQPTATS